MDIYKPYTYLIGWSSLCKYYYGVRYAKNCAPSDLWNPYKTSSRFVKQFIEEHGEPDIIEVRKVFDNTEAAVAWEHKVLKRLRVNINENWLNRTYNGCFVFRGEKNTIPGMLAAREKTKGKTYEEIFNNISKINDKKINSSITAKRNWECTELRIRMSKKPKNTENYSISALKRWKNKENNIIRCANMRKPKVKVACCIFCKKEMTYGSIMKHKHH